MMTVNDIGSCLAAIEERREARVVLVAGASCSGKTVLSRELARLVPSVRPLLARACGDHPDDATAAELFAAIGQPSDIPKPLNPGCSA